jgi:peroxiredoxin Q/BCP
MSEGIIDKRIMNVGDKIPEVLGTDQYGNALKSSDFRGHKLVLYSYPKANTSGCTAEACSLQAHKAELEALGYRIVGVSKDKQEAQKKFADAQGLEFPLIADTDTTLLQALGCWGEKVACGRRTIGTLRTTYLVNEEGVIEKIFTPKEIKTKIHAEQILKFING